jgi:multidrug efflux pump subunit AcrA (membrane-fusion protein)
MKKNLRSKLSAPVWHLSILLLFIILSTGCSVRQTGNADTYICPMHPTVTADRPGVCPVCNMDLVRKARPDEKVEITEELARLIKSPNEVVIASISTVKAAYKSVAATVQAQGVVTYDTRYLYSIPARMGGRLETVYLKHPFQKVSKGQKVAEIYSPELLTAQRELLYLMENDGANEELIRAAKTRLFLLGASEMQVKEIIARREAFYTFSVFSGYDGYVISEYPQAPARVAASAPVAPAMVGGMSDPGMGAAQQTAGLPADVQPDTELIREGAYVAKGQTLFNIVNSSALRVDLNIPIAQAAWVKSGKEIFLDAGNGRFEAVTVDFIQPFVSDSEKFLKARVYVRHAEDLPIGRLVSATLQFQTGETLWLPEEAIIDLGTEEIVFVKERGAFRPKKIITGIRASREIEVKQGLASMDEVAVNAQYLVDSESFIRAK